MFVYIQQKIAVVATLVIFAVPAYGQVENAFPVAAADVVCEVSMEEPGQKPPQDSLQIVKFPTSEQQRIAERLRDHISIKLHSAPLTDAFVQIQRESGINFSFDEIELGNAFKTQVVDIELSGISLHAALKIMLQKTGYGYVFSNEILSITSKEKAESKNYIRIYDVSTLEPNVFGAVFVVVDELAESQDQALGTFAVVGPNGFKAVSVGDDKLVIRAKLETHREIEEVMRQLVRKETKTEQANNKPLNEDVNYTSYLDEPSAFDEVMWDLPSLNEKLPPTTGSLHPSIMMPLEKNLFDSPGTYKNKYGEFVGYGAGAMILPEEKRVSR